MVAYALIPSLVLCPMAAFADGLPDGGQVTAGSASIVTPAAGSLRVDQTSQRAVVQWNDFSIGQGNAVTFVQPNASAATLNIVNGASPSVLAGSLSANGSVYLINQNGIAITPSGLVDTRAGFFASTLRMDENEFMRGRNLFSGSGGSVMNRGSIVTGDGGWVALLGSMVNNEGLISAPLGKVALASGAAATLDLSGDGFLQVMLPASAVTPDGQALVSNSGVIQADGGTVTLKAATVRQALREAVHMPGEIRARSVSGRDGAIVLEGGSGGTVRVAGALNADGDTMGGRIDVTGDTVALEGATLTATGSERGGLVRVGGEFQGGKAQAADSADAHVYIDRFGAAPALENATTTSMDAASQINVSATGNDGTGGTAIVWSDERTGMQGEILARGAESAGAVEISSKSTVQSVALSRVELGEGGKLLLDPKDIVIDGGGTDPSRSYLYAETPGGNTNLKGSELIALLSTGTDVSLQASNDITWSNGLGLPVNNPGGPGGKLNLAAGRTVSLSGVFTTDDADWTFIANDTAANGVNPSFRDAGFASIDLSGANFINSNGRLLLTLADGAGNGNGLADGSSGAVDRIVLGDSSGNGFSGNGLTAIAAPGASISVGGPISVATDINLSAPTIRMGTNMTATGAINLTGNLFVGAAAITHTGQSVTWTNEKTGGTITGEMAETIKFIENGVATRFGIVGTSEATRLELGNSGIFTRTYGDADASATGPSLLRLATPSGPAATDMLNAILTAGSLAVTGPGVTAAAGSGLTLNISPNTNTLAFESVTGRYFIDLTPGTVPLTITQRPLTPIASNGNYIYGSPAAVASLNGLVNGDAVLPVATLNGVANVTMASNGAGFGFAANVPAGNSTYSLTGVSGVGGGNYTLDLSGAIAGTLTIAQKPITFTGGSSSQVYGLAMLQSPALNGLIGSDDVSGVQSIIASGMNSVAAGGSGRQPVGNYQVNLTSLTGTHAANYVLAGMGNTPQQVQITPQNLTYQVTGFFNSTYGATATGIAAVLGGLVAGDAVNGVVTAGGNPIAPRLSVGSYALGVGSLAGIGSGNYQVAPTGNTDGTLNVAPKPINYAGTAISQTYGVSALETDLPLPGLVGIETGDMVTGSMPAINSTVGANRGESGAVPIGTYLIGLGSLTGADAGNYSLLSTGNTPRQVTITPKPLNFTLTGGSTNTTYGTLATLPGLSLSGIVTTMSGADDIRGALAAFTGGVTNEITDRTPAGAYTWGVSNLSGNPATPSVSAAGNYVIASSGNTVLNLSIGKRPLTWQVANGSAIYGDAFTNAATLATVLSGDVVLPVLAALKPDGTVDTRPVVGSNDSVVVMSLLGAAAGNYALDANGNTPGSLTITPRPLTYSVANASSVYGTLATPGAVTLSNLNLVMGESAPSTTLNFRFNGNPVTLSATSSAGDYLQQVTLSDPNYGLASNGNTDGILSIARKPISFVAPNASSEYGTDAILGAGTLSGIIGGDKVSAGDTTLLGGSSSSMFMDAGTYANQLRVATLLGAAAGNYVLTDTGSTFGTLTIAPKPLTYSLELRYGGQNIAGSYVYGTFSYDPALATAPGGFGGAGEGALVTLNGVLRADRFDVGMSTNAPVLPLSSGNHYVVGAYTWTGGALNGARSQNYSLANSGNTNASFSIVQRNLPVQLALDRTNPNVQPNNPVYGSSAAYTLNAAYNTLVGDVVTASARVVTPQGVYTALPERLPVGAFTVELNGGLSGADAANYNAQPVNASFNVTAKPVTVQAMDAASTYGQLAVLPAATVTGMLAGDDVSGVVNAIDSTNQPFTLTGRTGAGRYTLRPSGISGADAGNYTYFSSFGVLPFTSSAVLTIARLTLGYTVDPNTLSQTYGGFIATPAGPTGVLSGDNVVLTPQARPIGPTATGSTATRDLTASTLLDAGSYNYLPTLSGADANNYMAPSVGNITIARRTVTADILNRSTEYGTFAAAQVTLNNLVAGQTLTPVVTTRDAGNTAITYTERTDAGFYTAQVTALTGPTASNYALSGASYNLIISPRPLSFAANTTVANTYGSAALLGTLSGILFADDVGVQTVASGPFQAVRLTDNGSGGLVYAPRLNAGAGAFTLSGTLAGAKAVNYQFLAVSGGTTILPKPILYRVANAQGQYGNYQACEINTGCYPYTPGITLGAISFDGVLSGDTVVGTRGLLDLNGLSGSLDSTTPVGTYLQVVTGLTGASSGNYAIAPNGSVLGILRITPLWLSYATTSAVFVADAGLVGSPGVPTLRVGPAGTGPINGDEVEAVVIGRHSDGSTLNLSALRRGRYFFTVAGLTGADAGNYRVMPPFGVPFAAGNFSTNDVGTLDVFTSSTLGLNLASTLQQIPQVPPIVPKTPESLVADLSLTVANTGSGTTTDFGRNITVNSATGQANAGLTSGGASGAVTGAVTTGVSAGGVNVSAQASGYANALATYGVTGITVNAATGGHVDVMIQVGPGHVMYGLQADARVEAEVGKGGAKLSAESKAGVYAQLGVAGSLGDAGDGRLSTTSGVFVYARTDNEATAKDGKVKVKIEGAVGVGASAGVDGGISGRVGSVNTGVTVYTPGSLGGNFDWTAGLSNGALKVGLDLGAQIGIGGLGLKLEFSLDAMGFAGTVAKSEYGKFVTNLAGITVGPKLDRYAFAPNALEHASSLASDPAARFAFLTQNPSWKDYSSNSSSSTPALTASQTANQNFFNEYQALVTKTADLLIKQNEVQNKFLTLLKTDPQAAIEYSHSGAINAAAKAQSSLEFEADQLGVSLAVQNGKPTFVNKPK